MILNVEQLEPNPNFIDKSQSVSYNEAMNILLTGHKGFIGQYLHKRLLNNHTVIGLDIKDNGNILNAKLPEVDLVIHLAGVGGVRKSMENPKHYWDNNVIATHKILKHYANTRVLFASSSSQYEPWLNPYAASKNVIEAIPHNNKVAMRFHTVYGETNRQGMFFDKLKNGSLEYVTNHTRDFIHMEDCISAIELLIFNPEIDGTIDVGTGHSVRIRDLVDKNLPIKIYTPNERQDTLADITKLKSLGFTPKHLTPRIEVIK